MELYTKFKADVYVLVFFFISQIFWGQMFSWARLSNSASVRSRLDLNKTLFWLSAGRAVWTNVRAIGTSADLQMPELKHIRVRLQSPLLKRFLGLTYCPVFGFACKLFTLQWSALTKLLVCFSWFRKSRSKIYCIIAYLLK